MMNYVVMMHNKESDKYGQPLRVDSIADDKLTVEQIKEKIELWEDKKQIPVLITDPFMITVFDALYDKGELSKEKTEANELRSELRDIISDLEGLL